MFSNTLLAWYDKNKRQLPWRLSPSNPYYTWLSEIMLQQTTVVTVVPYFYRFVEKWPTVECLAAASLDEVLVAWQGLGYYSRARNLYQCAKLLAKSFPSAEDELLKLPGIGPYTAAAIASIAFEQKAAAVDGNVVRVLSRYFTLTTINSSKDVQEKLLPLVPEKRCGDFTQSLMELGALICRPKCPLCSSCPLQKNCRAYVLGRTEDFPLTSPKQKLPVRYTTAFILKREDGAILLRKRPPQGLLAGMMEVPTTPWVEIKNERKGRLVRHTFTHFHLEVDVCTSSGEMGFEGIWVHPQDLKNYALPTLMKKILKGS